MLRRSRCVQIFLYILVVVVDVNVVFTFKTVLTSIQYLLFLTLEAKKQISVVTS